MTPTTRLLNGHRIGIVGKGGSGKSSVTVLLARSLRKRGYEVCVLDADSTNVGLHQALGLERAPDSLVDYFGGMVFSGGPVTCPVDDPTPLRHPHVSLDQLPGHFVGRSEEGIWLINAGKMGTRGPGAGCDGPMAKVARDLRVRIHGEDCVTLIDFKAGLEDSARGVIVSLDWAVVVVDPTRAAVEMADNLSDLVGQIQRGAKPATAHLDTPDLVETARGLYSQARIKGLVVVINHVGPKSFETLNGLLEERGLHPVASIQTDPLMSLSWLKGERLRAGLAELGVRDLLAALEIHSAESREGPLSIPVHPQLTF